VATAVRVEVVNRVTVVVGVEVTVLRDVVVDVVV
jgi:hypothetical protein